MSFKFKIFWDLSGIIPRFLSYNTYEQPHGEISR